jgi:DNA-binding GntR family transcriptional regulator
MDYRELLETKAASLACQHIDDVALDQLAATVAEMRAAKTGPDYEDYRDFQRADADFHEGIANAAGSRYLRDAVIRLGWHYQRSRLYGGTGISDAVMAIREHDHVLTALQGGVPEKAATAMRRHLRGVRTRVLASIAEYR